MSGEGNSLVPQQRYGSVWSGEKTGNNVTNAKSNCLPLREDLHSSFEEMRFGFVPKRGATGISLVTYMLVQARQHWEEYDKQYCMSRSLSRVSPGSISMGNLSFPHQLATARLSTPSPTSRE